MKQFFVCVLACALASCGWLGGDKGIFRDRGNDYRRAEVEPSLKIPPSLDGSAIDDSYVIPEIDQKSVLAGEFTVPQPEPLSQDADRDAVVISRFGDEQWILVKGSPGAVWPRLRLFLNYNNIDVVRVDAQQGIIETAWFDPKEAPRERYLIRVDQGVQRETSEIYVTQADLRAGDDWPALSSSGEREDLVVKNLAQYLADSNAGSTISLLAERAHDTSGKVTLDIDDARVPVLKLALAYERGWASLINAVNKAGFTIDDRNHSAGLIYTHFKDKDEGEDDGWFSGWFSDEEDTGKAYLIRVKREHSRLMDITVEHQNGDEMDPAQAEKLLKLIRRYIT